MERELSKSQKRIVEAYERGYRVDKSGNTINPKGNIVKGCVVGKSKWKYRRFGIGSREKNRHPLVIHVHRLQAFQKFGLAMFEEGIVVRHLNGDSLDNSFKNISIGTHSDNMQDIPKHIRLKKALHATSFVRKYNRAKIIAYHKICNSYKKTMEMFNISSKGTLHFILNN